MVQLKCDCDERCDAKINSYNSFITLKKFFEANTNSGLFSEIEVKKPYYIGSDGNRIIEYFATKWFCCNCCGSLWEFQYPDFPANGYVRKIDINNYKQIPYKWNGLII